MSTCCFRTVGTGKRSEGHVLLPANERTGLSSISVAVFNQIRAVDRVRLIKRLGSADLQVMKHVDEAIAISLGLTEF